MSTKLKEETLAFPMLWVKMSVLVCKNNGMESKLGCGMQDESYLEVVGLGKRETFRVGQIVKKDSILLFCI